MRKSAEERFWANVVKQPNGCWVWTATCAHGYGLFYYRGRTIHAQNFLYLRDNDAFPRGLEFDHLCRNKACVNPEHLELVTRSINTKRGLPFSTRHNGVKTHCPQGHPYEGENLVITVEGYRRCRICRNAISRKSKLKCKARKSGQSPDV